ncbi:hypothetical protein LMH87_009324 [Akanthomyces muscarius]|uniref:Zn(2)-C6 fungal-type domain-containing protein n=1 Tax=Akanthomyces muscarius TaxID=2231603 RepID=A0A9W8QDS3_AKAMU|nr:hypothetical protein LMH87_009324 [Akanthomyces muscarius]KAJ4152804.1 hypothetical protein LMH87_009324 [Akanthomyces muscarius]
MTANGTKARVRDAAMEKRRQKKWAPRTRTGCLSCRQRHVKCDERKPSCVNCTAQGVACAYGTAPMVWQARQLNPALPQLGESHTCVATHVAMLIFTMNVSKACIEYEKIAAYIYISFLISSWRTFFCLVEA